MKKLLGLLLMLGSLSTFAETVLCNGVIDEKDSNFRYSIRSASDITFEVYADGFDDRSKCNACKNEALNRIKNLDHAGMELILTSNGWDGPMGKEVKHFYLTSQNSSKYVYEVSFDKENDDVFPYYCHHVFGSSYELDLKY